MSIMSENVMYKMKPLCGTYTSMELPNVMYGLNNIVRSVDGDDTVSNTADDGDVIASLEQRQNKIFKKLSDLQAILDQLKQKYGDTSQPKNSQGSTNCNFKTASVLTGDVVHDIVVNADPERPPLIVFVLYQLLKQQYKVFGTSFVHSSALSVPENLKNIFNNTNNSSRGDHQVALTVIWKKVQNGPEMMVSPHAQTSIRGEANIARYIMRLLNPHYDDSNAVMSTQIDEWLDMSQLQVLNGNKKEAAAAVKSLNSKLGRSDWLVGSSLSLADMVMWSALHQSKLMSEAPGNVTKWSNSCGGDNLFQSAKTLTCC